MLVSRFSLPGKVDYRYELVYDIASLGLTSFVMPTVQFLTLEPRAFMALQEAPSPFFSTTMTAGTAIRH